MAKKRIVKDKDGKQVEIDQDAVDAALAMAVTNKDGSRPIQPPPPPNPPTDWNEKELELANEQAPETNEEKENPILSDDDVPVKDECATKVALSQKEFVKACYDMNITANQCKYQSSKHDDKTIVEYIRSINKRIYDETQKGGYSTNVQFRVTPQDWVNVNHIFDWYRIRGFKVDVQETTAAPYGKEVGTLNYNFTISWADAQ